MKVLLIEDDPRLQRALTRLLEGDRHVVEVADDGEGFDPHEQRADDDAGDLVEGGLGIAIIRSVADELEIGAGEGGRGSRLRFVKLLDR